MALERTLSIWTVTDGRVGIENQALGLADAIQRLTPAEVTPRRVRFAAMFDRWPNALRLWPNAMLAADSDRIQAPFPDLAIANGRASLPFSTRLRRWSAGRTFVVQLQDPRASLASFDMVIPPLHDGLVGANVFPLLGSPNRITSERLREGAAPFLQSLSALAGPRVAVLVGGRSKTHEMTPERAARLADQIAGAIDQAGGSLMMTYSRRTPGPARAALTAGLAATPGVIWDGEGANPYFAYLHLADHILVTEDSVNMTTEAAATGKPVHVLPLDGSSAKFDAFHAALQSRGVARPFTGALETWTYAPLDETTRAAREVLERMAAQRPSTGQIDGA